MAASLSPAVETEGSGIPHPTTPLIVLTSPLYVGFRSVVYEGYLQMREGISNSERQR